MPYFCQTQTDQSTLYEILSFKKNKLWESDCILIYQQFVLDIIKKHNLTVQINMSVFAQMRFMFR